MSESRTVELERKEEKQIKKPVLPTDQRFSYSKEVLEWIAYKNKTDKKTDK